ncbi:MAG: DNA polymerase, partial [Phycisphaerales bacterium]
FKPERGFVFASADYSQIELRLLAHLSGDPALSEAFRRGEDIHRAVAAETFGVPPAEITDEQRSAAKMVNFGIVYGITPRGLARRRPRMVATKPWSRASCTQRARKASIPEKRRL